MFVIKFVFNTQADKEKSDTSFNFIKYRLAWFLFKQFYWKKIG